jgi:hypothetical protein
MLGNSGCKSVKIFRNVGFQYNETDCQQIGKGKGIIAGDSHKSTKAVRKEK